MISFKEIILEENKFNWLKPELIKLIDHAEKSGFTVIKSPSNVIKVYKSNKKTGKVTTGIQIYPDGSAVDMTVNLDIAKSIRNVKLLKGILGL